MKLVKSVPQVLAVAAIAAIALSPVSVAAQATSTIAGLVTDATGGVLPGVTVEASSPALIEQTRAVVTDGKRPVQHHRSPARQL